MKMRSVCLAPGRAAPGMILAAAVIDHEGHTLLTAGAELEPEMLDRLIRRGVECISVQTVDMRDEQTIAHELQTVEARTSHIFRGNGSASRQELHEAVLNYRRECAQ